MTSRVIDKSINDTDQVDFLENPNCIVHLECCQYINTNGSSKICIAAGEINVEGEIKVEKEICTVSEEMIKRDVSKICNMKGEMINENVVSGVDDMRIFLNLSKSLDTMVIHRGTLYMRIGPMFSGKTTWLNWELTKFADKGFSVLKISHSADIRNDVSKRDMSGSTHNSSYSSLTSKIDCIQVDELKYADVNKYHAIGVDEAQFFPDLVEMVKLWVEDRGKHVRVVGLDGDSFKRKFGQVLDLIPLCDGVKKMNASCRLCLNELEKTNFHGNILAIEAPFTKRTIQSTNQIEVGGSSKYIPVCRYHHDLPTPS